MRPPGWALYFKGGWGSGTGWADHQVALLRRGRRRLSVAILITSSPSHAYGNETLRGVAARLLRGWAAFPAALSCERVMHKGYPRPHLGLTYPYRASAGPARGPRRSRVGRGLRAGQLGDLEAEQYRLELQQVRAVAQAAHDEVVRCGDNRVEDLVGYADARVL